jgi:serine/threonine-protein kinase
MLRQTHHAAVLENWGLLWMWHSLAIFLLCFLTETLRWAGEPWHSHWTYLGLWSVGLVTWGSIFWQLRRRGGPVLFVERQIAHAWAAGICASISMFVIEVLAGMPALTLSPGIAVAAGMIFVFKAGSLSGEFYVWAGLLFLTAFLMTQWVTGSVLLFGAVTAICFFVPGLKYYRQRRRSEAARSRISGHAP